MNRSDDDKSRLERVLEVGVYAPVGFLVTKSKTMPDLAAAGRKQIAFARSLGQAALKGFVRSINRDEPAVGTKTPARAGSPVIAPPASSAASTVSTQPDIAAVEPKHETAVAEAEVGAADAHGARDGTVFGYDKLTAKEIIEFVKTCDRSQAQWIHDFESSHKQRVTVLRAAAKALG